MQSGKRRNARRNARREAGPEGPSRIRYDNPSREELRQLLQASLEATGDGILVVDLEGRIILSNQRFAEMWRVAPSVIEQKDDIKLRQFAMDQMVDPQSYMEKIDELDRVLQESTDILTFRDGRVFERYSAPLRISGEAVGRAMSFRDITAYREARRRLESSEQKYRELVENANSIILRWDTAGKITFINEYGQRLLGFSERELVGRPIIGTIVPGQDSAGRNLAAMIEGITDHPDRYSYNENENITKNGRSIWVSWSNRPIYDDAGRLAGILSIGTDITERKTLEQQLFQAQKMEAVGQLAGGIAHDFNNMLMVINGYCELLLDQMDESHHMRPDIQSIKATSSRAAALTRQLLAFGRRQLVQPKVVELNKLLDSSREMIVRLVGETVRVSVCNHCDSLYIYADPLQIEQIVLNLAANARDAMPSGGALEIETRRIRLDHPEAGPRSVIPNGSYALCLVRDTGSGMSADTLEHIFEPFFTTKDPGKGTGLGLSTVYGIVKQNDGYIFADSQTGSGSCFTLYFPFVTEQELVRSEQPHTPEKQLRGNERILLVESVAKIRRYTKTVLQTYGYSVTTAPGASDAMGLAKSIEVDLLISPVQLPNSSGAELVERIRAVRPQTRALLIAESPQPEDSSSCTTIGKPFTSETLLRAIRKVVQ